MAAVKPHSWLGKVSPCFAVQADQVTVLTEPSEFFNVLKEKARAAQKRVVLASLYLGTGHLEQELVDCLEDSCRRVRQEGSGDLEVTVLLDYTRGSRGDVNSRTMLLPLLNKFEECVSVSLYHTPDLRGYLRYILPQRFNETVGLTHIKVFLFDNSTVISGSNLSHDYFTNRQDRYIVIDHCKDLADFYSSLVKTVASFSFKLQKDNTLQVEKSFGIHPYQGDETKFRQSARSRVENLLASYKKEIVERDGNTWLYPLVQMAPFGVRQDETTMQKLLRSAETGDKIRLASGYFNLTDNYMDILLHQSSADYKILMASPEVNGFFGARGIASGIVPAYIYIAKQFYQTLCDLRQQDRIQLFEYYRSKWTFHVKGLWYYSSGQRLPNLTVIGSSNFGYRSVYRDLEAQLAIVTTDKALQSELHKENTGLYEMSSLVTEELFRQQDRQIPLWVKCVTGVIKNFF